MKFRSEYLDKELEFSTIQEIDEASGDPIHIIPHESLLSLAKELNLGISDRVIFASANEAVLSCTITDGKKNVSWIGESNPDTLDNEIKRKFRFTMAWNQAFDRAMIIFLQMPDRRIKSDMEMDVNPANKQSLGPQINGNSPYNQSNNSGKTATPEPNRSVQNQQRTSQTGGNDKKPQFTVEGDAKTIIDFGKYQGNPKTIKFIYENDLSFLHWVRTDIQSEHSELRNQVPDDKKYQIDAICRYVHFRQNVVKE